jgi:hypothetical protein
MHISIRHSFDRKIYWDVTWEETSKIMMWCDLFRAMTKSQQQQQDMENVPWKIFKLVSWFTFISLIFLMLSCRHKNFLSSTIRQCDAFLQTTNKCSMEFISLHLVVACCVVDRAISKRTMGFCFCFLMMLNVLLIFQI